MKTVYITEQGAFLTKSGSLLILKKEGKIIQKIHAHHIDQLIISGNLTLSTQTVAFLLREGVDTVFLSVYGKYRGRLSSRFSKNITIRIKQFKQFQDEETSLFLAKRFVTGKISNCATLLRRRLIKQGDKGLKQTIYQLKRVIKQIEWAKSLDALRGYEGAAAALYFNVLSRLFKDGRFSFNKRSRRPPLDRANALLSLGYTFLNNTVQSFVESSGLDPYLGVFHQPDYGRPSLGLDLMEEFRPVITDILVINLINKKIISHDDFLLDNESDRPCLLSSFAMKKFIHHYEKRIRLKIYIPEVNQTLSYYQIIEKQLFRLQNHISGKESYQPYLLRR